MNTITHVRVISWPTEDGGGPYEVTVNTLADLMALRAELEEGRMIAVMPGHGSYAHKTLLFDRTQVVLIYSAKTEVEYRKELEKEETEVVKK